jgi:quercetin dioxygenase-like cupin family protein
MSNRHGKGYTHSSMSAPAPVLTVSPFDGQCVSVVGDTYRIVLDGKQTQGAFAVIDMLIPPGGGPGPHAHPKVQETFYVIKGEVVVKSSVGSYVAHAGSFVSIPLGGAVHCFKNVSSAPAHLLCTVTPSGMEEMFRELGTPVAAGTFAPPPSLGAAELKRFGAIAEKYGQVLYPPDYLG